jgi:response regulator NasT
MESALIVSSSKKSAAFFSEMLKDTSITQIAFLQSCSSARRLLSELYFDLVIINAPLRDESGEDLSMHITSKGSSQVILAVNNEFLDAVSAICENCGVLVIPKPINKAVFWLTLSLARAVHGRMKLIQAENEQLKQKIEDMRIVDRAKWVLVSRMHINEKDAHRYIEKQAMNLRTTKRAIAEKILKSYKTIE